MWFAMCSDAPEACCSDDSSKIRWRNELLVLLLLDAAAAAAPHAKEEEDAGGDCAWVSVGDGRGRNTGDGVPDAVLLLLGWVGWC